MLIETILEPKCLALHQADCCLDSQILIDEQTNAVFTGTVVTRAQATLVTCGPYRWVRHPFYVTAALLMASVTILTANWLIGATSLVVLALLAMRTPREEAMLIARFGQQYRDYMARTGRFVPRRFH
jgi:protein-S-isoprenylcysteine O-methyltransferase Ste14